MTTRPRTPVTRRTGRRLVAGMASALAAALLAGFVGSAAASHIHPTTTIPEDIVLGQVVRIPVALTSTDGSPIRGATVVFYLHAVFGGFEGQAEVGRAVTDRQGMATLAYRPRQAGHHELRMAYAAPDEAEAEVVSVVFDVSGGAQLVRSAPGVDIPGLNVGLLMAVLATVWSILLWVALRLVAIAEAGRPTGPAGARDR